MVQTRNGQGWSIAWITNSGRALARSGDCSRAGAARRRSCSLCSALLAAAMLHAAGCASRGPTPAPTAAQLRAAGDPDGPPTLDALPELPASASANSERTHQGILVARQALDATMPTPPSDRSFVVLQDWADRQVVSWVADRRMQIDAARRRLLEGKPTPAEQILSHAVLALLEEDTARTLASIPAPKELDTEREIAAMYYELVTQQADTFVASALVELRSCVELARGGPEDMRAYDGYCHARFDRLRGELLARQEARSSGPSRERSAKASVQ